MLRRADGGYRVWSLCGRNVASFFHLLTLGLNVSCLVHLPWFYVRGCNPPLLGPKYFLSFNGHFDDDNDFIPFLDLAEPTQLPDVPNIRYYYTDTIALECISPEVLHLMRFLAFLCVLCIIASMIGFCLDILKPLKKPLWCVTRNSIPGVSAVLCIISMIGLSYYLTTILEVAAREQHKDRFIQVSYSRGFYTISVAGGLSLIATACNILQIPPEPSERAVMRGGRPLFDDDPFSKTFFISHPPPPPPYSP